MPPLLVMICSSKVKILYENQYSCNPDGKFKNMKTINIGIIMTINFCLGSSVVISDCTSMITPILIGNMYDGSFIDRSVSQKINGACLNSIDAISV
jgi:hypothetical protein